MPTRRAVLREGLLAATGLAATRAFGLSARAPQAAAPDEMTLNSKPHEALPAPDFGPTPATLPHEATAVRGKASLKAHAQKRGLVMGAAVHMPTLEKDPAMQQLIPEQFGMLVPENELKWRALRPAQDRFDFSASDALFDFAAKHHLLMRGHTLAWHNSVPEWLEKSPAALEVRPLLVEHIRTVMGRYRGRVQSWDVVNEAILPKDGQPGGLRKSFWYERVGPDYIDLAYRTAREADPNAKLTYNDYGVEYDNDEDAERRRLVLELLRDMRQRNVPLDAVGIQSHIKAGSPSTIGKGLADYIDSIHAMGLEVYLTELNVNEDDLPNNDVAQRDHAIAQTYRDFLNIALASPAVKLLLTWGVSDRKTWLNDGPTHHRKQPNRPQRSLPFDPEYRPTEAFFAIRDSLDKAHAQQTM